MITLDFLFIRINNNNNGINNKIIKINIIVISIIINIIVIIYSFINFLKVTANLVVLRG